MKRTLPALVVVLLLAAAATAVYFVQKPGHGGATPMAAADYLPKNTLLLLALPDPGKTVADWKSSDVYKIWSEPDVQAFLAKPLSMIPPDKEREDMLTQAARLKPKNLFIALTALDESSNQPHLLAGFQFTGPNADVDRLLAPAKDALRQRFPAGKADLINYQGHPVETFATGDGNTIASVYLGDWYLVANDLALLQATVDRVDRRTPSTDLSLEKDADFQAVDAKLASGYETLIFARVQPFISRMASLLAASGQPVNDQTLQEAKKCRAFGATTKIDDGKLRDTIYFLAPGLKLDLARLRMASLGLTSNDTLLYYAQVFHLPSRLDLPEDAGAGSPFASLAVILNAMKAQMQAKGITLESARAALDSEAAFQLDWPGNQMQPTVLWSVGVKDAAAAGKLVDALTSTGFGAAAWEVQQAGALTLHVLTVPNIEAFRPTLAVTGKSVILGLNVTSVRDAAAREMGSAPNLSQSQPYKTAAAELEKPNLAFSYLDTRTLFERVYGVIKPAALLGAAFLYPQASDYVDLGKLPPTEVISRHLSPTVMSTTLDRQGELIESRGSVTLFQAGFALAGGSAAVAVPIFQSRFGGLFPGASAPALLPPPIPPSRPVRPPRAGAAQSP
jgi:hypothetical protein